MGQLCGRELPYLPFLRFFLTSPEEAMLVLLSRRQLMDGGFLTWAAILIEKSREKKLTRKERQGRRPTLDLQSYRGSKFTDRNCSYMTS